MRQAPPIVAEVAGNRLTLIPGGHDRLEAILGLIDGATSELRLLYYMLSEDKAGTAVVERLAKAAERGVDVRLLIDGFGSSGIDPDFLEPLKKAGGRYRIFHPSYGRRYLIRNHQKMAIADSERALIGGANIDIHYLEDDGDKYWRDLWLDIEGPSAAQLADYYDDIFRWTAARPNRFRDLRRIIYHHSKGDGPVSWRFSGPMRRRDPWREAIANDIEHGSRLDMIAAYFSPSGGMIRRIGRLASRGRARVVTASKSDNHATIFASRHTYSRLLRRKVEIYEYRPARLHTKLYVVDDAVHIGSSNFDFRSLYINLEMMLRVEDAGFAEQVRAFVDREIADCLHVTPALHRGRATPWRRFKWWLSYLLVTTVDYTVTRRVNFAAD